MLWQPSDRGHTTCEERSNIVCHCTVIGSKLLNKRLPQCTCRSTVSGQYSSKCGRVDHLSRFEARRQRHLHCCRFFYSSCALGRHKMLWHRSPSQIMPGQLTVFLRPNSCYAITITRPSFGPSG